MAIKTSDLGGSDWSDGQTLFAADLNDTYGAVTLHRKQFSDATSRNTTSGSFVDSGTEFTLNVPVNSLVLGFYISMTLESTNTNGSFANLKISGTNLGATYLKKVNLTVGGTAVLGVALNTTEDSLFDQNLSASNTVQAGYFTPLKIQDAATTLTIRIKAGTSATCTISNVLIDVLYFEVFKED